MKRSISRRFRRRPIAHEAVNGKKENKQEQSFFGETFFEPFFKPVISVAKTAESVHRKCTDCEEKEKKIKRSPDKKEEDQTKVMKKEEKKEEEKLHRAPEENEEEKLMKKEEKEEEEKIQKKESATASNSPVATTNYINSINSKGQNMDAGARSFFETRMGRDFSNVKIHTGKDAADSSKEINAQAYSIGNHIVFNDGKYQPETSEGKHLLAHELTHILQQTRQKVFRKTVGDANGTSEESIPAEAEQQEEEKVFSSGAGTGKENKIANGNCANVDVSGKTIANYDHGTYTFYSTSEKRSKRCKNCKGAECIKIVGNIESDFMANPQVTLPNVPPGLDECNYNAVQAFIDGTLSPHEQQHVDAFNTYNGRVVTPFNYAGCRENLDAYILGIHNKIEAARVKRANAKSNALDPFNPTIPCNCPDPAP